MTEVTCPNCKKQYKVDSIYIGRRAACPQCQHQFVIESASPQPGAYSANPYAKPSGLHTPTPGATASSYSPSGAMSATATETPYASAMSSYAAAGGSAALRRIICAVLLLGCVVTLGLLNTDRLMRGYVSVATSGADCDTAKFFPSERTTAYCSVAKIEDAGARINLVYSKLKEVVDEDTLSDKDVYKLISMVTTRWLGETVESADDLDELGLLDASFSTGMIKDGDTEVGVRIVTSDNAAEIQKMAVKAIRIKYKERLVREPAFTKMIDKAVSLKGEEITFLGIEYDLAKKPPLDGITPEIRGAESENENKKDEGKEYPPVNTYHVSFIVDDLYYIEYEEAFKDEEEALLYARDIIDCWNGDRGSLLDSEEFVEAMDRISSSSIFSLYVNLPALIKPDDDNYIGRYLGKSIGCLSAELVVDAGGVGYSVHVALPKDSLWRKAFREERFEFEYFMPEDGVMTYSEMNMNAGAVMDIAKSCIETMGQEEQKMANEFQEALKREMNFDMYSDTAELFTGRCAIGMYDNMGNAETPFETLCVIEIKNSAKLWGYSNALVKFAEKRGTKIEKIKVENCDGLAIFDPQITFEPPVKPREARAYPTQYEPGEDGPDKRYSPASDNTITYAVIYDDVLLVSSSMPLIAKAIKVHKDEEGSIAQGDAIKGIGTEGCVCYSYSDMQKFYEAVKPVFNSASNMGSLFGNPYASDKIHKAFTVTGKTISLFESSASEDMIDEYGFSQYTRAEFKGETFFSAGNIALLAGCVLLGAGIILPRCKRRRFAGSSIPSVFPSASGNFSRGPVVSPPPPPPSSSGDGF